LAHLDRMTERERYRTMTTYFMSRHEIGAAIEQLEKLLAKYPADRAGRGNLALAYFYRRDFASALSQQKVALEMFPNDIKQRANFAWYELYSGDFDAALRDGEQVAAQSGRSSTLQIVAMAQAARGDAAKATETYAKIAGM